MESSLPDSRILPNGMTPASPWVKITIDQLADLIRRLTVVDPVVSSLRGCVPGVPGSNAMGIGFADPFLPANPFRRAIILTSAGGTVSVWLGALGSRQPNTWQIAPLLDPFMLRYEDIGAAITFSFSAEGTNAGSTINWQEFIGPIPLT